MLMSSQDIDHGVWAMMEYRPLYDRRYVDDIFALFNSAEDLKFPLRQYIFYYRE